MELKFRGDVHRLREQIREQIRTARVFNLPLDKIEAGERRREDYGDISGLAAGMKRVGLLSPILVTRNGDRCKLVCGGRRLRAAHLLKWPTIPAMLRENLTEAELRAIELEENDNRKALTEGERARSFGSSKKLVERAKQAAEVLRQSAAKPAPGKRGGRPAQSGSTRAVAEALGTSPRAVTRAKQHVETAEHWPFMRNWKQSQVLAVREAFENVPSQDTQEKIIAILACARLMDAALAVELIGKLAKKPAKEREEIYHLSQSEDPRDRSRALSLSKEVPPLPDPRWLPLDEMSKQIRRMVGQYPLDPFTPRLDAVCSELKSICAGLTTKLPGKERVQ